MVRCQVIINNKICKNYTNCFKNQCWSHSKCCWIKIFLSVIFGKLGLIGRLRPQTINNYDRLHINLPGTNQFFRQVEQTNSSGGRVNYIP